MEEKLILEDGIEVEQVYRRPETLTDVPYHYCPGCSHSVVHNVLMEVVADLGIQEQTIGVAPVGCSVFAYHYMNVDMQEAAHGRASAVATGIKRVMPDKLVFSYQGDGDLAAIGTAETIHTANRGENILVVFINNGIYGMTGGQFSPTTPYGMRTTTTMFSNVEQAFKISELAVTAGAVFVARGSVYHAKMLDGLLEKAFMKNGFSVVEVVSHCHTQYGRLNRMGTAVEMMQWQKEHAITVEKAAGMADEELADKFKIGVLIDRELPVFQDEYDKVKARAKGISIP